MSLKVLLSADEDTKPLLSLVECEEIQGQEQVIQVIRTRTPTNTEILMFHSGYSDRIMV